MYHLTNIGKLTGSWSFKKKWFFENWPMRHINFRRYQSTLMKFGERLGFGSQMRPIVGYWDQLTGSHFFSAIFDFRNLWITREWHIRFQILKDCPKGLQDVYWDHLVAILQNELQIHEMPKNNFFTKIMKKILVFMLAFDNGTSDSNESYSVRKPIRF